MDRDKVDELLRGVVNGSETGRRRALLALIDAQEIRAIPKLHRIAARDEFQEFRFLARSALADFGQLTPADPQSPAPRLDDPEPEHRIEALRLAALKGDRSVLPEVLNRCQLELDPAVERDLVTVVGIFGNKQHDSALERFLESSDPLVRANSIEALDLIGSANSYLKFVRFVLDPDPRVRYAATHALAHAGRERLIRLCIVVSRFEDPLDVEAALFLLDNLKTLEALSTFKEFITHDHPGIRHRARCGLVSLASVRSEEARDILENATLTAMPARPENVERGDPRLLTPSQYDALNDPDPLIRLEFVLGLEACTEPEAVTAMVQRLKVESDPRVQATMVRVLGIRGNSRHLDLVEEFLSDPHDRVRANAVEAYAHLGSAQQRLQLRRFLDDSCRRVVGNTILALWRRGQHAVRDRLTSLARSREPLDRLAAIYVIGIIGLEAGNLLNPLTEDADEEVARRAEDCQRILGLRSGRIVMESRACSGSKTI